MCCKEFGHISEECPKDPNYRSTFNIIEEDDRIENRVDTKKLNADAQVLTMRMLAELSKNKSVKLKGKDIMCFDDYQYNNINQYILDLTLQSKKKKNQRIEGQASSSSGGENSEGEGMDSDRDSKKGGTK